MSFMRGDKSLLGTMLERAGVDCEKLRQNIVGAWTKIKQAIGYIGEGIRNVVVSHDLRASDCGGGGV